MTINRESKVYRQIVLTLERVFLLLAGMYFIYRLLKSTTFRLILPRWFEPGLMAGLILVAFLRFLTAKPKRWETLIAVALAVIYGLVYRTGGYDFLLFLAALTVGFMDIGHRKILRTYLLTAGILYCVTVLAGSLGLITNYVRIKNGLRSAWGMSYPTDFASMGLYLLFALWAADTRLPDWGMTLICAAFGAVTWFIAHSTTSTVCVMLLFLATLYYQFEKTVDRRHPKLKWVRSGVNLFSTVAFPLLALCMLALMAIYAKGTNVGYRLNNLLSNRLKYELTAWRTYGLKPFGTPFPLHGDGFSVFPQPNYTFVDCSYLLILLRYGWVLFISICLFWGWMARRAIRVGDRRLVLIMGIIAIHSFSEHHFIDVHFNVLVAMPLAMFMPPVEAAERRGSLRRQGTRGGSRAAVGAWVIVTLLMVGLACLLGPKYLSWTKTVLEIKHYGHGEHSLRLICVLCGVLFGTGLAIWASCKLIKSLLNREGMRACRPAALALAACLVAGGGALLYADRVISAAASQNAAMVEADRDALETAVAASSGDVYSAVLPEIYVRGIEGVRYAPFFEDDLARLPGNTVLMPTDSERGQFISNGFLYVPISEDHAVYTGDRAVVEALTEAGYHPRGYFSSRQTVNLEQASWDNELYYDPQSGLRLDGEAQTMRNGPWKDLYGGRYTSTWTLRLPEGEERDDGIVCTLSLTTNKGENVVFEKKVRADKFDGQGMLTVSIPFKISSSRGVAFEAWAEPGRRVDIREISYIRTPAYDVHSFYDARLKKTRDEYYDRDGRPMLHRDGWFACDYEYDRYDNVVRLSYYDSDGQPVLIGGGYAQRRRYFNARRQIVREEFYGTDGALIVVAAGYAADEREYDAAGNVVGQRFFGADGEPCAISAGYAQVRRVFNDEQQVVRETYYGTDGQPIMLPNGYYGIEMAYDDAGNVAVCRYLDGNGLPAVLNKGYSEERRTYDGQHQVVFEAYYDTEGNPVLCSGRYAATEREYDEAGNVSVQRYLGLDGQPVVIGKGYAEIHREYNDLKQIILERYYGVDGAPVALSNGQYGVALGYDKVGNQSMRRSLDADGNPMTGDEGYAECRRLFNSRKKIIRESYYDIDGAPVENNKGYAGFEREYDKAGNIVMARYFDRFGNPVDTSDGYAEVRREYNGRRQLTRIAYYDAQGRPVAIPSGYHCMEMRYDEAGNVAERVCLDAQGNPIDAAA